MRQLRWCLKEPIPEVYVAARLLRYAVDAHLAGKSERAAGLFSEANMPIVRDWTESLWGKDAIKPVRPTSAESSQPALPMSARQPIRMPSRIGEAEIISRDGYHCRYCGIPVIHKRIRERARKLYPGAVTWGSKNSSQHAAFQAMWLQFDHVIPHSRGGTNDLSNVLIACAPCNFGKANHTIDELNLLNPFDRAPIESPWNGLEDFN